MSDEQPGYMTCVDRNFSWSGKVEALEFGVDNLTSLVNMFGTGGFTGLVVLVLVAGFFVKK